MEPSSGKVGKRKRTGEHSAKTLPKNSVADGQMSDEIQTLLKQHFEASFEPLQFTQLAHSEKADVEQNDSPYTSESEWQGLSDTESNGVLLVHHGAKQPFTAGVAKDEKKTFMTAKPPPSSASCKPTAEKRQAESGPIDAETDAANLQKDLALQRLLKESHLLESQSSLWHRGINRHKALDLRLQDMGSKSSIFSQPKMPLNQKRGISAKATEKEGVRRREAQANGIILEKANKAVRRGEDKRQRGIGAPSVGKFQGGMLKLTKKDVANIEGPKKTRRGK